jgi:DNA-binding winged helix-turn-helix (wHTH) protein/predicted ATPase
MQEPQCLVFGPFRLDLRDERLWRGPEAIPLSPKTFAVLRCLVSQAGQLVTKDALLEAVWPATMVSESILTVAMRTLRRALGDEARTPRFIETVHGRGYRFIAPVSATMPPEPPTMMGRPHHSLRPTVSRPPLFVGRDIELAQLEQWWTTARQGQRQVGMIVGEPGIGKTALVQTFVAQVRATEAVWVGHGQCLDHYGAGEAYLPVLEALGRLCRGPAAAPLVAVLRQHAPSWLVHLPAVVASDDRERLDHLASGVTPARMLRELAEALEVLTAARPLVLVLEDLHWSDRATLEWLAYVVRRRDPARLLILGTYRPVDVIVHGHPMRAIVAEFQHHPQYAELVLDYLSAAAVAAYLRQRYGEKPVSPGLPQLLHQRTGGNPLFLVAMVDELVRQGLLETGEDAGGSQGALAVLKEVIPASLRQYIEQHLEQLSEADQALLEAASVAGHTFSVAAVAAGVAQAPETIEARYTAFARQGRFIQASGTETWPDGTVTACYQFLHALYHEVVYARVSAGHRVRLHQQIGARKEAGYGVQARQIAAELAVHFTRGRDAWRAVKYLQYAGENALRRSAYQEAITQLTAALDLLATLPEGRERLQHELLVQTTLGPVLSVAKGYAAPEVERSFTRARELCQLLGDTPQLSLILWGLYRFYFVRAEHHTAQELAAQLLSLAQHDPAPSLLLAAHTALGAALWVQGHLTAAREHLVPELPGVQAPQRRALPFRYGVDPGVLRLGFTAYDLWSLGYADAALQRLQAMLTLAQELAHPFSLVVAQGIAACIQQRRRDIPDTQAWAEAALTLATEHGFPYWMAGGAILRGWALATQGHAEEGIPHMQQGLAAYRATGAELVWQFWLAMLAEAYGQGGRAEEGLCALAEALAHVDKTGERFGEAELHRLKGELLLIQGTGKGRARTADPELSIMAEAEACFVRALDIARRQQAKTLELRAAMSLARLWQRQGKRAAAYDLIAPIYGWFTEGFDTADLQEAKALLEELGG